MNIKALQRLIQIAQRQIETEILEKNILEKQLNDLKNALESISFFLQNETQSLTEQPISYCDYYTFYSHHKSKKDELSLEAEITKNYIDKKTIVIYDLFIQKKRYELLITKEEQLQKNEITKIENNFLNEVGLQEFMKKKNL